MAEWSKAPHSKCGIRATVSWVRIPPSPPYILDDCIVLGNEYDGLPPDFTRDAVVTIPMPPGHYPKPASSSPIDPVRAAAVKMSGVLSLNVATAGTVLCVLAYGCSALGSAASRQ